MNEKFVVYWNNCVKKMFTVHPNLSVRGSSGKGNQRNACFVVVI
jgi:hypothetical protein